MRGVGEGGGGIDSIRFDSIKARFKQVDREVPIGRTNEEEEGRERTSSFFIRVNIWNQLWV